MEQEELVTVVDNRNLRKIIHDITTCCLLTKAEFVQICQIVEKACDRAIQEAEQERQEE